LDLFTRLYKDARSTEHKKCVLKFLVVFFSPSKQMPGQPQDYHHPVQIHHSPTTQSQSAKESSMPSASEI